MMRFRLPENASAAIAEQKILARNIRLTNEFGALNTIAGVDVAYDVASNLSYAAIVVMRLADFQVLSTVKTSMPTEFPYISGLLSFREIPVLLKALEQLTAMPDILMVDGQGVAHPRRLGIAAHLGVLLDMPTLGVAKSRLTGTFKEPALAKGSQSDLMDKSEKIGTVLRSKEKCNPLFISPGHRMDHPAAVQLTMQCLTRYRLPEPTRLADRLSKVTTEEKRSLFDAVDVV
ncbi:MAG: deoxyribonuclease V [Rickettsiales bacterium]